MSQKNVWLFVYDISVDDIPIELTAIEFDILHALAENRGRIWAESKGDGQGSTFTFSLKIAK